MVTNNPGPHSADKLLIRSAKTRAMDLFDSGIQLDLFSWAPNNAKQFDINLFYKVGKIITSATFAL